MNQHCIRHAHFESRASRQLLSDHTLSLDQFRLVHYAGKVSKATSEFPTLSVPK